MDSNPKINELLLDLDDDMHLFSSKCEYIDPNSIQIDADSASSLTVLHHNINGLRSKIDDLEELLDQLQHIGIYPSVITLNETRLTDMLTKNIRLSGYSLEILNRKNSSGGGVGIAILDSLEYDIRDDLSIMHEGLFEIITIELSLGRNKKSKHIVSSMYRAPNSNSRKFLSEFGSWLKIVKQERKNQIIGTDQNLDLLKIFDHDVTSEYLDTIMNYDLLPTITKPTRITNTSATLIDNIYVSMACSMGLQSYILASDISDHLPCLAILKKTRLKSKDSLEINYRVITEDVKNKIKHNLSNKAWNFVGDANNDFNSLHDSILLEYDTLAPEKSRTISAKNQIHQPWITTGLLKSSRNLSKQYRAMIATQKHVPDYKSKLSLLRKLRRTAKRNYYVNKCIKFKSNSKVLWSVINGLIKTSNDKSNFVEKLKDTDLNREVRNPQMIANMFGLHFSSIGRKCANSISASKKSYLYYLHKTMKCKDSIMLAPTTPVEISDTLSNLANKKSSGYDKISNIMLKSLKDSICSPLSILINTSITSGVFPDRLKKAIVTPLHKAKEKDLVTNYRPISLLLTLSKVYEKVMHSRIVDFLEKHDIFFDGQHGFRQNRSTSSAMMEIVSSIILANENNMLTGALMIDTSKAFDTISQEQLLDKLDYCGIRGIANDWCRSYFADRSMLVQVNNCNSDEHVIDIGTAQGSILGPLFFCITINDICKSVSCDVVLYADDSTFLYSAKTEEEIVQTLSDSFTHISDYFKANKLSINVQKTEFMIFNLKNRPLSLTSIKLGDTIIQRSTVCKLLGFVLDDRLSWEEHAQKVLSKMKANIYLLKCYKRYLPTDVLVSIYYAHIHLHLSYGLSGGLQQYGEVSRTRADIALLKTGVFCPIRPPKSKLLVGFRKNNPRRSQCSDKLGPFIRLVGFKGSFAKLVDDIW